MLKQFLGDFVNDGFNSLLIQTLTSDRTVRHAVLALSSAQRMMITQKRDEKTVYFALRNYGRAIKSLNDDIAHLSDPSNASAVLMACVLLACFEYLRKRYDNAFLHLKGGFAMLTGVASCDTNGKSLFPKTATTNLSTMAKAVTDIFERLDLMNSFFTSSKAIMSSNVVREDTPADCYEPFTTALDARAALVNLTIQLIDLITDVDAHINSSSTSSEAAMSDAMRRQSRLRQLSKRWFYAFNDMINNTKWNVSSSIPSAPLPSARLSKAASILELRALVSDIMIETVLSEGKECIFDNFTHEFERIVTLADTYLQTHDIELRSTSAFCLELGVIAPLLYVISHCREPALRRKAINLLQRSHRREGPWEAEQVAVCAARIVKLEEKTAMDLRDGKPVLCAADVPEAARLHHAYFDLNKSENMIYCKRRGSDATGDWHYYEEYVE